MVTYKFLSFFRLVILRVWGFFSRDIPGIPEIFRGRSVFFPANSSEDSGLFPKRTLRETADSFWETTDHFRADSLEDSKQSADFQVQPFRHTVREFQQTVRGILRTIRGMLQTIRRIQRTVFGCPLFDNRNSKIKDMDGYNRC